MGARPKMDSVVAAEPVVAAVAKEADSSAAERAQRDAMRRRRGIASTYSRYGGGDDAGAKTKLGE